MFSEFIGEACVIIVIVISGFMLPSQKKFNQESIDKVFYAVVLTCVALQTALSMFSVYLMVKENFKKWKKYKLEKIIKKSQKVYPERTQTTFGEHNDQKIESPEKTGLD
jgi:TRAP-type C4-dicarboxylate transport system permease large subunit